jgi:hypothetical protein
MARPARYVCPLKATRSLIACKGRLQTAEGDFIGTPPLNRLWIFYSNKLAICWAAVTP